MSYRYVNSDREDKVTNWIRKNLELANTVNSVEVNGMKSLRAKLVLDGIYGHRTGLNDIRSGIKKRLDRIKGVNND
jgi:hypothetical protein